METGACDLTGGKLEQLDFNAPIISTRRLGGGLACAGDGNVEHHKTQEAAVPSTGDACTSVPFLWEAAPGVPKAADGDQHERDAAAKLPRPPPPPGRWRASGDDGGGGWDSDPGRRGGGPDDSGDEGDVDNGSGGEEFSNPADLASLTDSISVACSLDQADGAAVLDAVRVEEGGEPCRSPFPGFMMQRFLPAAAAVASSFPSDVGAPRKPTRRLAAYRAPRHHQFYLHHPREKMSTIEAGPRRSQSTRSYSSSKACGITVFFPWGFKQAFCGFKSSVQSRRASSRGPAQDGCPPRHSFRSEGDADGGGGGGTEARRARTLDTPGWGLRFLDCRGCEGVAVAERGSEGRGTGGKADHGRTATTWSLPLLRSPSEPWLAQALRSISKGT